MQDRLAGELFNGDFSRAARGRQDFLRVLRKPAVLISAAATFVLSFFYGAIEAFMPLLADQLNVRRFGIGILFAIAGMPSIILPRLAGYLADRLGDAPLLAAGCCTRPPSAPRCCR